MPRNQRESLIYTVLMCFVMIVWMSIYNVSIQMRGLSFQSIQTAWLGVPIAYTVGIILDLFFVSKIAKGIAFRFFLKPESSPNKKIFFIATGMVIFMCFFMSLYGAIEGCFHSKQWNMVLLIWLKNIPRNFIMAWPFQLIVAGPVVRKIFRSCFPVGAVQ